VEGGEEALPGESACPYCPAHQQFGGCRKVSLEMSDLVVQGRFDELDEAIRAFVTSLERMEVPGTETGE
jgi:hypothetical protein